MGLPWIRLDTSVPDNPKMLGLLAEKDGHRAAFVWVCCMAYAGKHETAGFVTREAMPRVNGRGTDMALLVRVGLLVERAGGWDIHGWDQFQVTTEDALQRKEKAQHAAAVRWSKTQSGKPLKAVRDDA